jgi:hypothetical protein
MVPQPCSIPSLPLFSQRSIIGVSDLMPPLQPANLSLAVSLRAQPPYRSPFRRTSPSPCSESPFTVSICPARVQIDAVAAVHGLTSSALSPQDLYLTCSSTPLPSSAIDAVACICQRRNRIIPSPRPNNDDASAQKTSSPRHDAISVGVSPEAFAAVNQLAASLCFAGVDPSFMPPVDLSPAEL